MVFNLPHAGWQIGRGSQDLIKKIVNQYKIEGYATTAAC
jgi:hypothetical protein